MLGGTSSYVAGRCHALPPVPRAPARHVARAAFFLAAASARRRASSRLFLRSIARACARSSSAACLAAISLRTRAYKKRETASRAGAHLWGGFKHKSRLPATATRTRAHTRRPLSVTLGESRNISASGLVRVELAAERVDGLLGAVAVPEGAVGRLQQPPIATGAPHSGLSRTAAGPRVVRSGRRSCEMTTTPPSKPLIPSTSASTDSMSRWFVGSSSRSTCGRT